MKINQVQILLLVFGLPLSIFSQSGHGFSFDNYSGIYGSVSNPANTVQSKHRWHVNGLSYNHMGIADFGAINYLDVEKNPNGFNSLNFNENTGTATNSNFMMSESDVLLPSVLWNISDNHALGLLIRSRSFSDYSSFNGQLFSDLNLGFNSTQDGNTTNFDTTFNSTTHYWKEIGLNYALVLLNTNYHFVKFGGTAKYLLGTQAVELTGTFNGSYASGTSGDVTFNSGSISYLKTTEGNLANEDQKFYANAFDFAQNSGTGYGGDIGLVYEWRPRETNRVGVRSNAGAVNTYKLKISAAVLDIGSITYKNRTNTSGDNSPIVLENLTIPLNGSAIVSKNDILQDGIINTLKTNPNVNSTPQQGEVTFALPRSLNLGLDYIIFNDKNYYINLNYIKTLTKPEDEFTNSRLDLITLTPRYETQKFSVYLPITYEQSTTIYAGLGLRFGPVTVGSAALSSLIMEGEMKHLYFGLNLPLFQDVFR